MRDAFGASHYHESISRRSLGESESVALLGHKVDKVLYLPAASDLRDCHAHVVPTAIIDECGKLGQVQSRDVILHRIAVLEE